MLSHVRLSMTPQTVVHRLLCPWDFPGKNTGSRCHFLLQGIFLTQGLELLHRQVDSLPLGHLRSQLIPTSPLKTSIVLFYSVQSLCSLWETLYHVDE